MPVDDRTRLCLSVATLFIASCAHAPSEGTPEPSVTRVKCLGINGCSGQGECAAKASDGSELNACGGQNGCSGKGWLEVDESECKPRGGQVLAVVERKTEVCATPSVPRLAAAEASERYNVSRDRLANSGYDPVAYFPEGGGAPTPGRVELTLEHEGVVYRFASADNLARFQADPRRYEPAFGGWCAYAMGKNGRLVDADPEAFIIEGGQLLLFYRTKLGDTRDKWKDEPQRLRQQADLAWSERTGECRPASEDQATAP